MTDPASPLSLLEALSSVPDPRRRQGTRHPLPAVLALLSVATMCGCRSIYAILQWGRDQGQDMARRLGLGRHGIPTDGMMSNLLRALDRTAFEAALARWAQAWAAGDDAVADPDHLEPVSIDGKTLRGARGHAVPGVHLLAAYATRLGVVLNQVPARAFHGNGLGDARICYRKAGGGGAQPLGARPGGGSRATLPRTRLWPGSAPDGVTGRHRYARSGDRVHRG